MCTIIIVKCSWDGLPEGRNCFCVWSFWCSELCSVDQMAIVQRGAGCEGSRGILPALLLTLDKYSSWRVGRVVPMIRSAVRLKSSEVRFGSWAEPDSYWCAEDWFNDGRVELYQQLLWQVELPQLAKDVKASAGPFSQWTQCDCPTSGPGRWWCPVIWMTPLQFAVTVLIMMESGGSPEVHEHLHCFERVQLQVVKQPSKIQSSIREGSHLLNF